MQKTYWWRVLILILAVVAAISGYIIFYPYQNGLCDLSSEKCVFSGFKKTLAEPLFLLALSLLFTSIFLFFTKDAVFLKWLKFAIAWFLLAILFIVLAPVYSGGSIGLNPTKESVSIWMGSLFVIFSLVQIVWYSKKVK